MAKGLYRFQWSEPDVKGIFVATHNEVDSIMGKYIDFGFVDKVGPIRGCVSPGDITLVSDSPEAVDIVLECTTEMGLNPVERRRLMEDDNYPQSILSQFDKASA